MQTSILGVDEEFTSAGPTSGWQLGKVEDKKPFTVDTFLKDYRTQATAVAGTGGRAAGIFYDFTKRIVAKFLDFAKQAVEIAVSKFLVELCAMIIAAVSGSIMGKYKRPVDITTGGVFYGNGGGATQASSNPQAPLWSSSGSAFDGGWGNQRVGATAW